MTPQRTGGERYQASGYPVDVRRDAHVTANEAEWHMAHRKLR